MCYILAEKRIDVEVEHILDCIVVLSLARLFHCCSDEFPHQTLVPWHDIKYDIYSVPSALVTKEVSVQDWRP